MIHPFNSANISIFQPEISNFFYILKYKYRLHSNTLFRILLSLLGSLKVVLINTVIILMTSAKLATLGLLLLFIKHFLLYLFIQQTFL